MALDKATVAQFAALARIRLSDAELEPLASELSQILDWVEQLNEVDTTGVAPMASAAATQLPMRDDAVTDGGCRDATAQCLYHADTRARSGDGGCRGPAPGARRGLAARRHSGRGQGPVLHKGRLDHCRFAHPRRVSSAL